MTPPKSCSVRPLPLQDVHLRTRQTANKDWWPPSDASSPKPCSLAYAKPLPYTHEKTNVAATQSILGYSKKTTCIGSSAFREAEELKP